jgi:hypothetical protein
MNARLRSMPFSLAAYCSVCALCLMKRASILLLRCLMPIKNTYLMRHAHPPDNSLIHYCITMTIESLLWLLDEHCYIFDERSDCNVRYACLLIKTGIIESMYWQQELLKHCVNYILDPFFSLLFLFKKNKSRLMRSPCCLCVCMCIPPNNFWMPEPIFIKLGIGTCANLNGVIHKSCLSVIPTLQPFRLLKQNLNIAW